MVINTSAIVAIALDEPDAFLLEERIADDPVRLVSAATFLEAAIVLESRLGKYGGSELDLWLHRIGADIVPVSAEHGDHARGTWRRGGKGRHPAGLNFGDCFSYALASLAGEPLLFKGDNFAQTDVASAR